MFFKGAGIDETARAAAAAAQADATAAGITAAAAQADATTAIADAASAAALAATKHKFVGRGDPTAPDLAFADMICDDTWREWDMSGVVPVNAKLVLLRLHTIASTGASWTGRIRGKGKVNDFNITCLRMTTVANVPCRRCFVVPDENGIIEYKLPSTMANFSIVIGGWFV